jgi:hypothetical protein
VYDGSEAVAWLVRRLEGGRLACFRRLGGCRLAATTARRSLSLGLVDLGIDEGLSRRLRRVCRLACLVRRLGGVCRLALRRFGRGVAWLVLYDGSEEESVAAWLVRRLGGVCHLAFSLLGLYDGSEESVAWPLTALEAVAWLVLVMVMILLPSREGRLISSSDRVKELIK